MGEPLDFDYLLNLAKENGISEGEFWKMTLGKLWADLFPESTITQKDLEAADETIIKEKHES